MDDKTIVKTQHSKPSINMQVFAFELLLIVLGLLMILVVYSSLNNQMVNQRSEYIDDVLRQKSLGIQSRIKEIGETMFHATYNRDVISLLQSDSNPEVFEYSRSIDEYVTQLKVLEHTIDNIIFYNSYINYNKGFDPEYNESLDPLLEMIDSSTSAQYLGLIEHEEQGLQFVFGNSVYDSNKTLNNIGKMVFVINADQLLQVLDGEIGSFILVDKSEDLIYSLEKTRTAYSLDDEAIIVAGETISNDIPFRVAMLERSLILTDDNQQIRFIIIVIGLLMGAILVVSYLFINSNVVSHLRRINTFIQSIKDGDFSTMNNRLEVTGAQELCEISLEFNSLLDELKLRTERLVKSTSNLYQAEITKKEAELNYLRSQINPHFLYNTLNVVKGIAALNDQKEIEAITMSLVKIFRYSIKGEDFVHLNQELDVIKAYLQIQTIRFEDSFSVDIDIEDHLMETEILKMILQPILENAIQHGIEHTYEHNQIVIRARETADSVELIVEDDGVGMTNEQLEKIRESLDSETVTNSSRHHIGIMNVHRRLRHYYGQSSGIYVESELGTGTKVTIRIDSSYIS